MEFEALAAAHDHRRVFFFADFLSNLSRCCFFVCIPSAIVGEKKKNRKKKNRKQKKDL